MGIDIQTYRARIGTNRSAFGVDMMTTVVRLNFHQICRTTALAVYLLVMITVAFVDIQDLGTNVKSVITEQSGNDAFYHSGAPGNAVSHLQMIGAVCSIIAASRFVTMKGAVRFIGLLLLIAGIESNPGPRSPLAESEKDNKTHQNEQQPIKPTGRYKHEKDNETRQNEQQPVNPVEDKHEQDNKTHQNEQQPVKPTGRYKHEKEPVAWRHIFELLHLRDRLDQKISTEEAITIYNFNSETASLKESPWILLQKLMFVNWNEGEGIPNSLKVVAKRNSFLDEIDDTEDGEISEISVIDIFMAVFYCTDIRLRPILFQKMHLCKIAIPFVYKHYLKGSYQIARWPLQLLSEYNDDTQAVNTHVMNMETNVVTFVRFGRPSFSKSLFLNRCFHNRSNAFHTFFNKDCRSGFVKRHLHEETVEISWLPSKGPDSVARTFLNVRGDFEKIYLKSNGKYPLKDLILKLTDVCVAIVDIGYFHSQSETLLQIMNSFPCHILLLSEHSIFQNRTDCLNNLNSYYKQPKIFKQVILTHQKHSERDVPTLVQMMNKAISRVLQQYGNLTSIERKLNSFCKDCDFQDFEEYGLQLEQGKLIAQDIFNSMLTDIQKTGINSQTAKNKDRFRNCLTALTPVSYIHSKTLYNIYKELRAPRESQAELERIKNDLIRTRHLQLNSMTKTIIAFAKFLVSTNNQPLVQHIFIHWLKVLIDKEMTEFLPGMITKKNAVYEKILLIKKGSETIKEEEQFVALEGELSASSLTVDHLLREVSHVYDSIIYLNERCEKYDIPETENIIQSFTYLMLRTEATDIVTEHFFMPQHWISELFKALDTAIPNKDSITIVSALGLQSTGKSTLLNTMYGQQFRVRGGRCTKGVQARLVPVCDGFDVRPSKFIMVFDSEGLRAPELQSVIKKYDRDNELATFVSGLGNISIMTVNGENATELTDIVQIVVHASLRLKTANANIVLGHKCLFVHNNVENQSEKLMQNGYVEFKTIMDTIATEAAQSEGLVNIRSFNDIMKFDERRPFKTLPNIWYGGSEIRIFNSEYSKKVAEIKSDLTRSLGLDKYVSFRDISRFARDIWDGVISENFVFSFRNSLEMQLYCHIEKEINEKLWHLQFKLQKEFNSAKRKETNKTLTSKAELKQSLSLFINSLCSEAETFISNVLQKCQYPNIAIQWKSKYIKKVGFWCDELKRSIYQDIDRYFYHMELETETASIGKRHRDVLKATSIRIAQTMQGKERDEYDKEFDKLWNTYEMKFLQVRDETLPPLNVRQHFRSLTIKKYSSDANLSNALSGFDRPNELHSSTLLFDPTDGEISTDDFKTIMQEYSEKVVLLIGKLDQTKGLIFENDLQLVFEDIVSKCNDVDKSLIDQGVTSKTTFVTGLVHTLQNASNMIDSHNETYDNECGFSASLKRFRNEMYDFFVSEIKERRLEEKAARQFCHGIENAVREIITENLTIRAKEVLVQVLPNIKFNLIKTVCCSLLKANCFSDFVEYIKQPRRFCCSWYKQECNKVLHSEGKYMELLKQELTKHQREIQSVIFSTDVNTSDDVLTWFRSFAKHMTLTTCNEYHFESFLEIDKLEDFECFLSVLMDKGRDCLLSETFERIENSLGNFDARKNAFNVLYESLFDTCWGCAEVCPFCFEPCMKLKSHAEKHQCLQHRPLGVKGTRHVRSKEMVLSTCNFLVNSKERRYYCRVIAYTCGCEKPMTRDDEGHLYRKYREFFNEWDIMPSSDPHGCCKYWLWFVGKYVENLKQHYEYKTSEVPESWFQISDEEALESLDNYFTAV